MVIEVETYQSCIVLLTNPHRTRLGFAIFIYSSLHTETPSSYVIRREWRQQVKKKKKKETAGVRYEEESGAQRVNHGLPHQASRAPLTMTYRLHYVTLIIREKCESQESRGIRHDAIWILWTWQWHTEARLHISEELSKISSRLWRFQHEKLVYGSLETIILHFEWIDMFSMTSLLHIWMIHLQSVILVRYNSNAPMRLKRPNDDFVIRYAKSRQNLFHPGNISVLEISVTCLDSFGLMRNELLYNNQLVQGRKLSE